MRPAAAVPPETADVAQEVIVPLVSVVGAVVVALLVAVLVGAVVRSVAKKSVVAADLSRRSRNPLRAVLVVIAVRVALLVSVPQATWESSGWLGAVGHVLLIALIAAATWLIGTLAFVVEDAALSRYRVDVKDNRHARRVRTQVQLLRRITVALLVVVAVAAVLLTFPGVSAFGASLLASAGVLSIVAGLAAQSSLANVFAGLQLAFTDAIRVDDVVVVEQEWGRIEEITLTYVVVHVWDDRRLILPSTHFTQTPFENWTRRAAELLGTVELDVDWQVPVDDLRAELNRLLDGTDLWDRRVGVLQVTDAVGGMVRLRALASAVDAPTLFDLRCYLREGLVAYLQSAVPQALPRTRIETTHGVALPVAEVRDRPAPGRGTAATGAHPETGQQDARLFTGSIEAEERSRSFAGPGQDVIDEREEHAAAGRAQDDEPTPGRSSGGRRVDGAAEGTAAVPVAAPRAGGAVSGAGRAVPDVGGAVSDVGGVVPDAGGAVPGAGRAVSDVGGVVPSTGTAPGPVASAGPVGPPAPAAPGELTAPAPAPASAPAPEPPSPATGDTQRIDLDPSGTMVLPATPDEPPAAPPRRSVRSTPLDPPAP